MRVGFCLRKGERMTNALGVVSNVERSFGRWAWCRTPGVALGAKVWVWTRNVRGFERGIPCYVRW